MRNYGHEQPNSRTSWVICNSPMIRNIISKGLELEDTTPLKDTRLMEFMQNLWAWTTLLKGLHDNMELMHTTLLISYLLPQT
ncbi:hypothetical protein MTR67_013216 [Solanum verrucosum]|uniref:Uncharacterized protein n=1 Tax=Solanum verrucosum TaxID=315347 RepID=A0AAF0QAU1_SOLVR|nr:hypothetical protein MTR67_013216 [Solanum verrucosum]